MEAPLDDDVVTDLVLRYKGSYGYTLQECELLWNHLLGRLVREKAMGKHTTISLDRVGSELEGGKSQATKTLQIGELTATYNVTAGCTRSVRSNYVAMRLLAILLDGYALVGNVRAKEGGRAFGGEGGLA